MQASNAYGVAVSSPGSLTVSSVPGGGEQCHYRYCRADRHWQWHLVPTWNVTTNNSLIAGQLPPGSTSGDFSLEVPGRSVSSLTAGGNGALTQIAGTFGYTTSTNYVTCGNGGNPAAGSLVTYALAGSASGYSLTNITVYGGWADDGRDQQAYTVYYSKTAAPATFILLGSVNYNPTDAANAQSATRATLTSANGVLATNVAVVKFDFTSPASENGYCGYSEINLFGMPTPVAATNPTNITYQVVANNLTLSWPADHSGWQLQVQTNSLNQGLGTNWSDVAGATLTNRMTFPINTIAGSVFYRLSSQ